MEAIIAISAMAAVFSWAMSKEEVFREHRETFRDTTQGLPRLLRYIGYIPTCEYCFSFWFLVLLCLVFTPTLVLEGWRGHLLAHGVCWACTVSMMSVFQLVRVVIRKYGEGE